MAKISIADFKSNFQGGTRENRFRVSGIIPGNGEFSTFHIRTTQIPTFSTTTIEYGYFGRKAFYPGEKQYQPWSVRIIDDTGQIQDLWKKFNRWQNKINDHKTNNSQLLTNQTSYKGYGWRVDHLDLNGDLGTGNIEKSFYMHGCWPKVVDSILLSMTNPNALNEFNVIFLYDWIELGSKGTKITRSVGSS